MPRLFLIRHGETVDNVAGLYAGSRDSPLTVHGVLQARRLADHLASSSSPFTHVFSSDLQRAVRTAEAICHARDASSQRLSVVQLPELREKHFGTGEGTRLGSAEHEGAETDEAMRRRVDGFLAAHVFSAEPDAVICVVAHGVILGVLCRALSLTSPGLWWSNTGYLEATLVGRKLTVARTNCVDHLRGLKRTRGVGSAQFDDRQRTMDSFFKPKRRKLDDE